jgi:hypothetical protein
VELRYNGWGMVECTRDEMNVTFRQLDPTLAVNVSKPKARFTAKPGIVEPTVTVL